MDDIDLKSVLDQVGPEGDKLVSSPLDGRDQSAPSPMRTEVSNEHTVLFISRISMRLLVDVYGIGIV